MLEGLQLEELHQVNDSFPDAPEDAKKEIMAARCKYWEALMRLLYLPIDTDEVVFIENLKYPLNYVVKSIMKMFSLETWLYAAVNKATRQRDHSKVDTLGPAACLLSHALLLAAKSRQEYEKAVAGATPPILLYRSYRLGPGQKAELRQWKRMKNRTISMQGYLSALPNKQNALRPALKLMEEEEAVLLFEISLLKEVNHGGHFFRLGTESYTVYPEED